MFTSPRDIIALSHFENDNVLLYPNMGVFDAARLVKRVKC